MIINYFLVLFICFVFCFIVIYSTPCIKSLGFQANENDGEIMKIKINNSMVEISIFGRCKLKIIYIVFFLQEALEKNSMSSVSNMIYLICLIFVTKLNEGDCVADQEYYHIKTNVNGLVQALLFIFLLPNSWSGFVIIISNSSGVVR